MLLRSKARWAPQGEKVSKYFCGLEKRHFVSKQMFKLFSKHGKGLDNTEEMSPEMKTFYQQLYSDKKACDVKIEDYVTSLPKLTENEPDLIEGLITLEEASKVLKKKKKKQNG